MSHQEIVRGVGWKTCSDCGRFRVLKAFPPHNKTKDGRQSYCRSCKRERDARYRGEHRERIRIQQAEYRRRPDHVRRQRQFARTHYEEHRDEYIARASSWKLDNPDRAREIWTEDYRRRSVGRTIESCDYAAVLLSDPCSYCGGLADEIDHIDPVVRHGTNDWENLTAACKSCNSSKSARMLLMALA